MFPAKLPTCIIPQPNLAWPYSLYSLQRPLVTGPIGKQLQALSRSLLDGSLAISGKPLAAASVRIIKQSLEEFLGFCWLHLGLHPNLKTVLRPTAYAHFVAFQKARGLREVTQKRCITSVISAIPAIASGE